jgi:phosphohistidine phosphatase
MPVTRTLFLMRHAHAESFNTLGDKLRPLDDLGREQAAKIGHELADAGIQLIVTSAAARARQTAAGLGLGVDVEVDESLYDAGTGTLIDHVRGCDDAVERVLVVGHNPVIAGAVYRLLDERHSDPTALDLIATHFPTATCCQLEFEGRWKDLGRARLIRTLRTKYPK